MKQRAFRLARNLVLSVVVLAVLVAGAGAAYTWYMGGGPSSATPVAAVEPVATAAPQAVKRHLPAADAPASASIQQLSSPVAPGGTATLTARSNRTAVCAIKVQYSDKQMAVDAALVEKSTDEFGMADWQWTLPKTAPKGKATVTVTCSLDEKRSAVVTGDLEIGV